ncbi:MAG: 50S ribosomal protein L3 N(5)-glutamine methyltransferase [Burkholderiaceae bacterium]|nr:50S ribosomal protein L3 N(5)-glutamine methyltransferase [Burkholderiaceae bacterium]MCG3143888.1 50S ribosomal protein L3 glutamine methyltransferase [Gammaproteobacteria bacterium]
MKHASRKPPPATARELIYFGQRKFRRSRIFYGHGTREALDESVYLVLRGLELPFGCPDEELDRPLTRPQIERVRALLQQRIDTRKPAAYLLNEAYFCGLSFYVDERVLIPRSPIAELIERSFSPWVEEGRARLVLDLCTGSGCIAIGCALAFPEATVIGADISPEALAVAAINVRRHGRGGRVRLVQSDLFAALTGERFDLIVSNPPYVPAGDIADLPAEYGFEPSLALAAGEDGLGIVTRILQAAADHLNAQGVLVVEVGDRERALAEKYPDVPFTWLEFERGSGVDGVFVLDAEVLQQHFPPRG